jgi:hypothetical protein
VTNEMLNGIGLTWEFEEAPVCSTTSADVRLHN